MTAHSQIGRKQILAAGNPHYFPQQLEEGLLPH